jgi:hypothetical protein
MMGDAIGQCSGETLRPQGLGPFVKRKIAGDQGGSALVALRYRREE